MNSCKNEYSHNDLLSDDLIDTLIRESIIQSSINCYKNDQIRIDSFKQNNTPYMHYGIYNVINTYVLETKKGLLHHRNAFSTDYLLTPRFVENKKNLFNVDDTSYISFQIKNSKKIAIDEALFENIDLIDSLVISRMDQLRLINKKNNKQSFRFNYFEFYTPLLNKQKNTAIVGASGYHYFSEYKQGFGTFIILKRDNRRWKRIDEVMWWTN
jgi:hypothetical protein